LKKAANLIAAALLKTQRAKRRGDALNKRQVFRPARKNHQSRSGRARIQRLIYMYHYVVDAHAERLKLLLK
jgi:hypothetical protein